jgi:hypothetical protein
VNSKQIVSVVAAVALVLIIVYPAVSTGTVTVYMKSANLENADHVYVVVKEIWAHQAGQSDVEGWKLIANQSQALDLVNLRDSAATLGKGDLSLASYDGIRLNVVNVTWVYNKTATNLQVEFSPLQVTVDFVVKSGGTSSVTLVISGHKEELQGSNLFAATMTATTGS